MQLACLVYLVFCVANLVQARPEGSIFINPQKSRKTNLVKRSLKIDEKFERENMMSKPVKRFLGGSKSTTNATTSTTSTPKTTNKLESKSTKFTTMANEYMKASSPAIRHESPPSSTSASRPKNPSNSESRLYPGENDGVYDNDMVSPIVPLGAQYGRLQNVMSSNSPLLAHGLSSQMSPMAPNNMAPSTAPSSLNSESNWSLIGSNRNNHPGNQPARPAYGHNRNQYQGMGRFENATTIELTNDFAEPMVHNLDPSVKYNIATSPNTAGKLPTFAYSKLSNSANAGSIPNHKDKSVSSTKIAQSSNNIEDDVQSVSAYAAETERTESENKPETSSIFSVTEPRSISDSQYEYVPLSPSEKLASLYSISQSSDVLNSRPPINRMDAYGGRYDDDSKTQEFPESKFQDNNTPGQALTNLDGNETPMGFLPSSFAADTSEINGEEIGVVGHKDYATQSKPFIGFHSGYNSENGFDTSLDRHNEYYPEMRYSSIDPGRMYSSSENMYNTIYSRNDQSQEKSMVQPQDFSCNIDPKYNSLDVGGVDSEGFLQPPVRRNSNKTARHSKHKE